MNVERFTSNGLIQYRLHSDFDGESITVDPFELNRLLSWLKEHELEIVNDGIANTTRERERIASVDDKDINAWLERESDDERTE